MAREPRREPAWTTAQPVAAMVKSAKLARASWVASPRSVNATLVTVKGKCQKNAVAIVLELVSRGLKKKSPSKSLLVSTTVKLFV